MSCQQHLWVLLLPFSSPHMHGASEKQQTWQQHPTARHRQGSPELTGTLVPHTDFQPLF